MKPIIFHYNPASYNDSVSYNVDTLFTIDTPEKNRVLYDSDMAALGDDAKNYYSVISHWIPRPHLSAFNFITAVYPFIVAPCNGSNISLKRAC